MKRLIAVLLVVMIGLVVLSLPATTHNKLNAANSQRPDFHPSTTALDVLSENIAPTGECFACTAADKKWCENNANMVLTQCMVVWNDHWKCEEQASDYWEQCYAERGCPVTPKMP